MHTNINNNSSAQHTGNCRGRRDKLKITFWWKRKEFPFLSTVTRAQCQVFVVAGCLERLQESNKRRRTSLSMERNEKKRSKFVKVVAPPGYEDDRSFPNARCFSNSHGVVHKIGST